MSSAADTAISFCRECLGWGGPTDRKFAERNRNANGGPSRAWTPYIFDYDGKQGQFHYTDMDEVLAAVRAFIAEGSVKIESQTWVPVWYAEVWVNTPMGCFRKGQSRNDDPCVALMAACVDAVRRARESVIDKTTTKGVSE